jgi:hypothetical protein
MQSSLAIVLPDRFPADRRIRQIMASRKGSDKPSSCIVAGSDGQKLSPARRAVTNAESFDLI